MTKKRKKTKTKRRRKMKKTMEKVYETRRNKNLCENFLSFLSFLEIIAAGVGSSPSAEVKGVFLLSFTLSCSVSFFLCF